MKVYVDLVFFLNVYLDFLLLMTTAITLKRKVSIKRLLLGTCMGSTSIFFLFFSIHSLFLFLFKLLIAFLMVVLTFQYKDYKYTLNNLGYFYMISVILGGFLYYLNVEFSYSHVGLVFFSKKININGLFLLIISPIILYIYYKQSKNFKMMYNLIYDVEIDIGNQKWYLKGFLDTGNKLVDPITNKPIVLIEKGILSEKDLNVYYVPFNGINEHKLLKCFKPTSICIGKKKYKNILLGISDKKFHLEGVECLLNNKMMEDLE